MPYERPADLFAREHEWAELAAFAEAGSPGLRVAIMSGRRRQGKSFLLRRLAKASGGLYHQAQELERAPALDRFAGDVADALGLSRGQLTFADWETAIRTALGYPDRGRSQSPRQAASGRARLVVLDELPYLLGHSPEIPSVLQELHDEARNEGHPPAAMLVCGSALSVMTELLAGTKPLRGRAQLDMTIGPFDYRTAAWYWDIADPDLAFHVHTVFGGTAGYRPLVPDPPARLRSFPSWLGRSVLNPAHALFNEKDYLLREDPRIEDKQLYNSILASIALGNHTPKNIGTAIGRTTNSLRHPLGMLESTGFLAKIEDMLTPRKPLYFLADPIVRFSEIVIDPYRPLLEERAVETAWELAAPSYRARIAGPHFEQLARTWTAHHAGQRWGGEAVGSVGPATVNDPAGRTQVEVDVVGLAQGSRRADPGARVIVLGEAKASHVPRGLADLSRLERIRSLVVRRGHQADTAHLAIFGRAGFKRELLLAAEAREDVHLVDLKELYREG